MDEETRNLLASAADGDSASWGQLLTGHVDRLRRLLALRLDRRLQGRIDFEDVIQEIYAEAWHHLPEYQRNSPLPFYLWLRGLARNKLFELHRQHIGTKRRDVRREENDPWHGMPEASSAAISSMVVDRGTSPINAAIEEEIRIRLEEALDKLDGLDREIIVLRHFEQLSPKETALVLGVQEKAAGMRYVRAIKRLRKKLASLPGGLSGFRL